MQTTFILGSSLALLSLFLSNDSSPHLRNWIYESSVPLLLLSKCLGIGARWKKRLGCKRCNFTQVLNFKNIAKGTTDSRVEFISQDHSLQFTNLEHITISTISTSKSQPDISNSTKSKVKILAKLSLRILTKIQFRNLKQTSAKY